MLAPEMALGVRHILAPCADLNPIAGAETMMVSKFS
jgi:hypothetical protein